MGDKYSVRTAVENVFSEREKFIVIGLTGRTGAGCTTLASMLKSQSFKEFGAPRPTTSDSANTEERQYRIANHFLKENWHGFYVISAADVITSFILEHDIEPFAEIYAKIIGCEKERAVEKLGRDFCEAYHQAHEKRLNVRKMVSEDERNLDRDDIYEFNFQILQDFTAIIKKKLNSIESGSYTELYQRSANNIRRSGDVICENFAPEKIFRLAQRVNSFIKQLRIRQKREHGRVLVCIDAIRNSFEASFFRERYAAFYLVSVATDECVRRQRLRDYGYPDRIIDQIDAKERPKKLSDAEFFYSQNIQKCIEMADIHIYNPQEKGGSRRDIKKQILKYIALIVHPGLVQPTDVERCMQIAINAKLNSGCLSRQVGAAITDKDYSIKAIGWNNTPEHQVPCNLRTAADLLNADDTSAFSDYEKSDPTFRDKLSEIYMPAIARKNSVGWPLCYCFKDIQNCVEGEKNQVHTRALHAEENAFLQITKYGGQGIKGGYLFTTSSPCELCAKKAYQLGISNIYYLDPYPGIAGSHILDAGGAKPKVIPFVGAVNRGYQQLFEPVMPHKEALKALVAISIPNVKTSLGKRVSELESLCEELRAENDELKKGIGNS
jgi:deoxycytidylate deaminase